VSAFFVEKVVKGFNLNESNTLLFDTLVKTVKPSPMLTGSYRTWDGTFIKVLEFESANHLQIFEDMFGVYSHASE